MWCISRDLYVWCLVVVVEGDWSVVRTSMTSSQKFKAGSPSSLSAASSAIISASLDEWLTAVCFLQNQLIGTYVWGPIRTKYAAEVDLLSLRSPAKDASQKSASEVCWGLSPTQLA